MDEDSYYQPVNASLIKSDFDYIPGLSIPPHGDNDHPERPLGSSTSVSIENDEFLMGIGFNQFEPLRSDRSDHETPPQPFLRGGSAPNSQFYSTGHGERGYPHENEESFTHGAHHLIQLEFSPFIYKNSLFMVTNDGNIYRLRQEG